MPLCTETEPPSATQCRNFPGHGVAVHKVPDRSVEMPGVIEYTENTACLM